MLETFCTNLESLQVKADDRIKLEDLPHHPWLQDTPVTKTTETSSSSSSSGLPIPRAQSHQHNQTLNSVGSANSPPITRSHAKLCRKSPGQSKKSFKNEENNSILASTEFPHLPKHCFPQKVNLKDLKNEANEARRMEDVKMYEFVNFSEMFDANNSDCRVKVEKMESADNIHLLSHATAYATL